MAQLIFIDEKRCQDPGELKISANENQTPLDFWSRANGYTCPLGPDPGSAWVILTRADANTLAHDSFHTMRFEDGLTKNTISSLGIVRQFTMNRALAGDEKAAVLIELQDKRRQLRMSDINKQYNIRIPAPSVTSGTSLYYTESRNGGALWTWQTMLDDIWAALPSIAGTAPTLPFSPDATPEGFRFIGVNAWDALHVVLTKLQVTTRWDPFANVFAYIRLGVAQTLNLGDFAERLVYDYDPGQGYDLSKMPATVRVYFGRRELYQGIEKDTTQAGNWEMAPFTSIDVATNVAGALSGTVQQVWDDLAATRDGAGAVDNAAALTSRANEIGAGIVAKLNVSHERNRKLYEGIITFLPGSEVTEVVWRNYGDGNGLFTELIQSPKSAAIEGSGVATVASSDGLAAVGEHLESPDLSRNQYPLFPRVSQLVQVDDGSSSTGATLTANGDGLYDGFVLRYTGSYAQLDACWIRPADLDTASSPSEATVVPLRQKDRLVGRLYGIETSGGTTLPVYVVRKGDGMGTLIWAQGEYDDDGGSGISSGAITFTFGTTQGITDNTGGVLKIVTAGDYHIFSGAQLCSAAVTAPTAGNPVHKGSLDYELRINGNIETLITADVHEFNGGHLISGSATGSGRAAVAVTYPVSLVVDDLVDFRVGSVIEAVIDRAHMGIFLMG